MRYLRPTLGSCAGLIALIALGCGTGKKIIDTDREPVTTIGTGATVLMPGQTIPMESMIGPGTGNVSFIGGAYQQVDQRNAINSQGGANTLTDAAKQATANGSGETPMWQKALAAPFVAAAWPLVKLAQAMEPRKETSSSSTGGSSSSSGGSSSSSRSSGPGAATEAQQPAPAPRAPLDPNLAVEEAQLLEMEREIAAAGGAPAGAPRTPTASGSVVPPGGAGASGANNAALPWQGSGSTPTQTTPSPQAAAPTQLAAAPRPTSRPQSIAEELASLQVTIAPRPSAEERASGVGSDSRGLADRVRDRDGNGRPDLWSYHDEGGRPTRELLDEDGDGAPDRTVWFDAKTGDEKRVEEDTNLDGRVDSWVEFRDGQVARQRRDRDHDGHLDSWSFYRGGTLAREEEDTSGDGFRNRVAFYDAGRLVKEREDRNGDGRVDRLTLYDDERLARRDEDSDGDGRIDMRSVYEQGRLVRRELVEDTVAEEEELSSTEWDDEGDE